MAKGEAPAAHADDGDCDGDADGDNDAGIELAPSSLQLPQTPRTPRHPPPSWGRSLSMDPGVHAAAAAPGGEQSALQRVLLRLRAPGACFKTAQLTLSVLCLGLVSDGYVLTVGQNVTAMHFPFIVFSSNTIITGVILFGYVTDMKMRVLLMRIFGVIGGLLFLISAIHTANHARVFWEDWEAKYEEGVTTESLFDHATIPRRRACFVAQTALAFAAAALHLVDAALSCHRTLALLR